MSSSGWSQRLSGVSSEAVFNLFFSLALMHPIHHFMMDGHRPKLEPEERFVSGNQFRESARMRRNSKHQEYLELPSDCAFNSQRTLCARPPGATIVWLRLRPISGRSK